jgi:hypothetical protein
MHNIHVLRIATLLIAAADAAFGLKLTNRRRVTPQTISGKDERRTVVGIV